MKVTHDLKTLPKHFEQIWESFKKNEVRKNDREFKTGDILNLREYAPNKGGYTKRELTVLVTHVLTGGEFGIASDYAVLSIMIINRTIIGVREKYSV